MGAAADLVAQGYYGYQGWDDSSAAADFKATGGSGKGNSNGGGPNGSGGGFQPLSPTDIVDIQNKVYNQLKPYYMQLLTEANGDYDRAVKKLNDDYSNGVRVATSNYNTGTQNTLGDLGNSLAALGINFNQEQDQGIDSLNKRGMAVYQNGPDGQPNVVQKQLPIAGNTNPSSANLNTLNTTGADMSGINPTEQYGNQANLGQGGHELNQMLQDQQLRQEAVQRAGNQKLQTLGMDFKNYTNPTATDPAQMGTAELSKQQGLTQAARDKQLAGEGIYNQMQNQVSNLSSGFANNQVKANDVKLGNMYNVQSANDFINNGLPKA